MTRAKIAGGALATMLVLFAPAAIQRVFERDIDGAAATSAAVPPSTVTPSSTETHEGLLYGRVTTDDGAIYEGRLRWGGDEEALWGNYFNGFKDVNPWVAYAPADQLPTEHLSIGILGLEIAGWDIPFDLGRPFMARFGDIARIDPRGYDIRVTLKSGTVLDLDRLSADDLADGVRVWDSNRGVVDIGEWQIRSIELLPAARSDAARPGAARRVAAPYPLHGTVHTRQGDFTGLVQWNREDAVGSDELSGHTGDGELSLRFDAIRSIARRSSDSSLVTLLDGREIVLSGTRDVGRDNRGIYVDDARYGRVLVSWDAFDYIDFSPGGTGPTYGDFLPGRPLRGSVTTRSGLRLVGRLVYDLDESETTETLDAPFQGVDYTIPFSHIASIVPARLEESGAPPANARARVTLHSGEELQLEPTGDLGERNAGLLIFVDGREDPEYVSWSDVVQVDFESPPVRYGPSGR